MSKTHNSASNSVEREKELPDTDAVEHKERECFIIMPISDPEGYDKGHFSQVFNDLIQPACEAAGYKANRADQAKETDLIHVNILKRLLEAPMAICDLSSRNPNVLFELGIRQAFDKPVVLIEEAGTPRIFDISSIRTIAYRPELKYREVLNDQKQIADALNATANAKAESGSINSLIKLLSITAAQLPTVNAHDAESAQLQLIREEMSQMRAIINRFASQQFSGLTENSASLNLSYNTLLSEYLSIEQNFLVKAISSNDTRNSLIDLQMRVRLSARRENNAEYRNKLTRLDKELTILLSQIKNSATSHYEEPPF